MKEKAIVPDRIAALMSPADRKALGVLLPSERADRADARDEKELQKLCERELSRRLIPFSHYSFRARERIGWPDLTFAMPATGRFTAVELKSATGKLTQEQADTLADLSRCGAAVYVCRSFESFVSIFATGTEQA